MVQTEGRNLLRVFAAVELPEEVRRAAASHAERLRETTAARARVSWEREEKLHVTLKFFGDLAPGRVDVLSAALSRAAVRARPCVLRLQGTGVFPAPGRPHVLWLGIADDTGRLAELYRYIEDECGRENFPRERRPFHPHVTLARVRESNRETRALAHRHVEIKFEASGFEVGEVVLMRSELGPGGSVYTPLSRHRLVSGEQ